jgi:PTH1 family peptidyl-tRNA hydrolase
VKLICGLGNPGAEHAADRHNAGFLVVDRLADQLRIPLDASKFDARVGTGRIGDERLLLLEPETYMNLSGRAVAAAARFYKVEAGDLLVVHDELDLDFGRLQLKLGGGIAGHNGLRSIVASLGEDGFARLRMGVGKPEGRERTVGHVLSGFSAAERAELPALVDRAAEAAIGWATLGAAEAMTRFNRKGSPT